MAGNTPVSGQPAQLFIEDSVGGGTYTEIKFLEDFTPENLTNDSVEHTTNTSNRKKENFNTNQGVDTSFTHVLQDTPDAGYVLYRTACRNGTNGLNIRTVSAGETKTYCMAQQTYSEAAPQNEVIRSSCACIRTADTTYA